MLFKKHAKMTWLIFLILMLPNEYELNRGLVGNVYKSTLLYQNLCQFDERTVTNDSFPTRCLGQSRNLQVEGYKFIQGILRWTRARFLKKKYFWQRSTPTEKSTDFITTFSYDFSNYFYGADMII